MRITPANVLSSPCIMVYGRGKPRTIVTSSGRRSISRFSALPWESLITNSVAPLSRAAWIAALVSSVMISRNFEYSNPAGESWSALTTPVRPSMSTEM